MLVRPRGTVVRTPQDWFARYLMSAGTNNGPCVGNLAGIALYNNATDGSVIRVYGLNIAVGTQQIMFFKSFSGSSGTLVTTNVPPAMIDPRTPLQPGKLYTQATAAGVGSPIAWRFAAANVAYDLSPGYPLAIIPPNYSFSVECTASNTQINVGFTWLSVYE